VVTTNTVSSLENSMAVSHCKIASNSPRLHALVTLGDAAKQGHFYLCCFAQGGKASRGGQNVSHFLLIFTSIDKLYAH